MAADKNIRCTVVYDSTRPTNSGARPSDLLPWADPYIASLVKKLQREVRQEATAKAHTTAAADGAFSPWDLWDMCYDDDQQSATRWDDEPVDEHALAAV